MIRNTVNPGWKGFPKVSVIVRKHGEELFNSTIKLWEMKLINVSALIVYKQFTDHFSIISRGFSEVEIEIFHILISLSSELYLRCGNYKYATANMKHPSIEESYALDKTGIMLTIGNDEKIDQNQILSFEQAYHLENAISTIKEINKHIILLFKDHNLWEQYCEKYQLDDSFIDD